MSIVVATFLLLLLALQEDVTDPGCSQWVKQSFPAPLRWGPQTMYCNEDIITSTPRAEEEEAGERFLRCWETEAEMKEDYCRFSL